MVPASRRKPALKTPTRSDLALIEPDVVHGVAGRIATSYPSRFSIRRIRHSDLALVISFTLSETAHLLGSIAEHKTLDAKLDALHDKEARA